MVKTLKEMKDITSKSVELLENIKAGTAESIRNLDIIKDDLFTAKQTINVIQRQRAATSRSTESMKSWKDTGTIILLLLIANAITVSSLLY